MSPESELNTVDADGEIGARGRASGPDATSPVAPPAGARSSRPRILLLIKGLGRGGAELLVLHMMRHRDRDRFDYEVAYILEEQSALVPELEEAGVPVHSLGARGNRDLAWTLRLRSLLRTGDFDIVHSHLPYAAVFSRLVAATLPKRDRPLLVNTEHSPWDKSALVLRALNRATICMDDRLLVVSESGRRSLPRALQRRAQLVIHGIEPGPVRAAMQERDVLRPDVRDEFGLLQGELLALTVANLRPTKAYDVFLQAARLTQDRDVPVRYVAAGSGYLRDELEAQHARLGLGDRFRFIGERTDVPRLLAGADLFVLPSRQEGLPVAIMEATSAGVPLVVTPVNELGLLFTDGVNALVVPPEDPEALAAAVATLVGDGDLRQKLACGSLARGELFDVTRCVREVEAVYDEMLSSSVRSRA
jgi:glycosyltransferase involved in cell wall biosynthesis